MRYIETYADGDPSLLPLKQRIIDDLLSNKAVRAEFRDTMLKSTKSRTRERDSVKKPRFKFLSDYKAAIYDSANLVLYEGKWNDYHEWIAESSGVAKIEDKWNGIQRYISATAWVLRAAQDIKVLQIDTFLGFSEHHLEVLETAGYTVMDPEYQWVIPESNRNGYILTPSKMISF